MNQNIISLSILFNETQINFNFTNYNWKLNCIKYYNKSYTLISSKDFHKEYKFLTNLKNIIHHLDLKCSLEYLYNQRKHIIICYLRQTITNTKILKKISILNNLETLQICHNLNTKLPIKFILFNNLKKITLIHNNITSISTKIGLLINLLILQLHHNKLKSIPTQIGLLTNLTSLKLNNNKLTTLPTQLSNLQKLDQLIINNNKLTTQYLFNLPKLRDYQY
jgi:Leucine-rich repeat (LRR) protein